MKIVNAKLYEQQIREKMWEVWYDEKYQWYFDGYERSDFNIGEYKYPYIAFAILNDNNELIGLISYTIDPEIRRIYNFGAINFSNNIVLFGRALKKIFIECFTKFGMNSLEWNVVCGNPIEESYDRLCKKYGGNIIGIKHQSSLNLHGDICDSKLYELLREDFLKAISKY